MNKVTIKFEFSDIEELKEITKKPDDVNSKFTGYVKLKDESEFFLKGKRGLKLYKQLCRNFAGEHLD